MSLRGKKITLGLTGGIACYKVPFLVRDLVRAEAEVQVIMTASATKFITPLTLETVSGRQVETDMFPEGRYVATRHIDLAQDADLIVIVPATANFIGKVASGVSDDLLTTVVCAASVPVMIAPAMNPYMWSNPITQRNCKTLQDLGYLFVGPDEGEMACEAAGVGRLVEPNELFEAVKAQFGSSKKKALDGKKVIVTAGPSREAIDPVRFISNRSSGKMGYAIAAAAAHEGAETVLVTGPTSLPRPEGCRVVEFESTAELHDAVQSEVTGKNDILIMAAAPADYTPANVADQKIKKGDKSPELELVPTVDVLNALSKSKRRPEVVVGFALETENAVENGRKKLKSKNLDLILVNSVSDQTGFDHDTNQVTLIAPRKKPMTWPLQSKSAIASKLIDYIAKMS